MHSQISDEPGFRAACLEIIEKIGNGVIDEHNLEKEKTEIAKKHGVGKILKNAEIFHFASREDGNYQKLKRMLRIKPVRTISGVANISVMWLGENGAGGKRYSCPGSCIYCVQGENSPKSYTGCEPTTMRAIRNDYDAEKQVANRLKQLQLIGHSTDKCELIIMGGTFPSMPAVYQESFVKRCFDAFNGCASTTLQEAQVANESAGNRCVGLTIETRADFCNENHVKEMLRLGCTRVELGVQSTDDKILEAINRGHSTEANIAAIRLLKDSGLKVAVHWMPGLTGLFGPVDEEEELRLFKELFDNPDYRPDELKIYPVVVLPGTRLHEMWKNGSFHPLTGEQMLGLLIKMKQVVPSYVRIKRVMRDISEHETSAGAATTNLRQLAQAEMKERGLRCKCIRCREIGFSKGGNDAGFVIKEYEASNGREFFISYESGDALLGFLRLRLCGSAHVRELHVYGEATPIGSSSMMAQHRGIGKELLAKAESITKMHGFGELFVTSGVGVREYYRRLGYTPSGSYVVKRL
jgi:elongator complex protein 3